MKRGVLKFTACAVVAGMTFSGAGSVAFAAKETTLAGLGAASVESENTAVETEAAETGVVETEAQQTESETLSEGVPLDEPVVDESKSGEIAFAQCEEYINVRTDASADSEVVGKVYNNGSVTILRQVGDWYEVQSGNATGYVKAEYFATGDEAQAIANEVAYNVATVYPEALTVRSGASEDSESIGMVYAQDELEVVEYDGDWMKVVLDDGTYGYINAYYVDYDTYYSTAETLEEEEDRLNREWEEYLAQQAAEQAAAEQAYLDAIATQEAAEQQAAWDAQWQAEQAAQQAAWDAQYQAQEAQSASTDAQSQADAAYQAYLDAQAQADAATQTADSQAVMDTAANAQAAYQTYLDAQAQADAQAVQAQQAADQAQTAQDTAAAAADAAATADTYTDTSADTSADTYTEPAADTSSSSTGQAIVNFATQFVGNPYVWGGTSLTGGADCSGFTQSVFANFGISIPRTAASQSGSGTPVDLSQIQAGDLLFYQGSGGIGHVSIYMGNGQVVHASNSNTGITISDYGYRTPCAARRYW